LPRSKRSTKRTEETVPVTIEAEANRFAEEVSVEAALCIDAHRHLAYVDSVLAALQRRSSLRAEQGAPAPEPIADAAITAAPMHVQALLARHAASLWPTDELRLAREELARVAARVATVWAPLRTLVGHRVESLSTPKTIRAKAFASAHRHALTELGVSTGTQRAEARRTEAGRQGAAKKVAKRDRDDREGNQRFAVATERSILKAEANHKGRLAATLRPLTLAGELRPEFAERFIRDEARNVGHRLRAAAAPRRVTKRTP
jgi:hypothetical protein